MGVEVTVPAVSGEPAEVYLSEWLVDVGDVVAEGAPIALIEADKAQVEIMAPSTGRVVTLHAQPDDPVRIGQVIAVLESQ